MASERRMRITVNLTSVLNLRKDVKSSEDPGTSISLLLFLCNFTLMQTCSAYGDFEEAYFRRICGRCYGIDTTRTGTVYCKLRRR